MPIPGGTAGAHDDSMHQGSAKRDTASGVAGLNASSLVTARLAYENVASGVAGLDASSLLSPVQMYPCLEGFSNHLGAVDNFTQTAVSGNGTATADAANHEMDLSTGITVAGYSLFQSKPTYTPGTKPIIANFLVQNIVDGTAGYGVTQLGLKADFSTTTYLHSATFDCSPVGTWKTTTGNGADSEQNAISPVVTGDLLTIMLTSASARFFVNGTLVATHATYIPGAAVTLGAAVHENIGGQAAARQISIDYMSVKRYV